MDEGDIQFLSHHLAPGTAAGYGYVFDKFSTFCVKFNVDPFTCPPWAVVKYLREMYNTGAKYSTVNHHRSAISKFHAGVEGMNIGEHPLVRKAVRAVFRLRPPLPKYVNTFDITNVFTYISNLPPNSDLSLTLLTYKTLFLLTASSLSRMSSVSRLGSSVQFFTVCTNHNCILK